MGNTRDLFKKIRDTKETFHAKMGTIKDRNSVDLTEAEDILKEMEIPDHLTWVLRNLYAGQEETVRTGHETVDWFQIRKGVHHGCILSPCLFNFLLSRFSLVWLCCDPIDGSPPGAAIPWILQARILEWVAISLSNAWKRKVKVKSTHHEKCWAGRSLSWNQNCREKYQELQICRWPHPYGKKQRGTKDPLDESEREEWKSWLKIQHSEK